MQGIERSRVKFRYRIEDKSDPVPGDLVFRIHDRANYREGPGGAKIWRASLTRVGVLDYHRADIRNGEQTGMLRHPDDVFDPKSLASLAGATVTVDHPPDGVDPKNFKSVTIGHLGDTITHDEVHVFADVYVSDADAQEAILRGDLVEFSCGYDCFFEHEDGLFEGSAYQIRQREITYNHVAIGPLGWGRAGPTVRIQDKKNTMKFILVLDGKEHQFDTAEAALEAAKGAIAAKDSTIEKGKKELADSKKALADAKDPKAIKKRVKDRSDLMRTAARVLDSEDMEEAEDAEDVEVMKAVIEKTGATIPEGASDDWIAGAYAAAVAAMPEESADSEESDEEKETEEKKTPVGDSRGFKRGSRGTPQKVDDGSSALEEARKTASTNSHTWAMSK